MTPFALAYDPDTAPVIDLIGTGYRPAWQPADYIGARLDCAMWIAAPDADVAYLAKYDLPPVDPYAPVAGLPLIADPIMDASAIAVPPAPVWPDPWAPCCVIQRPADPLPQLPDVPVPASAGLLLVGLVALAMVRGRA